VRRRSKLNTRRAHLINLIAESVGHGTVFALKKAAFGIGAEFGKGLMSCRRDGVWGTPAFMKLEKGDVGLQIVSVSCLPCAIRCRRRRMKRSATAGS